ncbi:rifampicin phosphotransferase-like isoform X2 [Brevipalpus obovatus]|uniref:rifampicin phosphotransferase-like isoform X2 n=1 Tax=Brevipalpus obovatus TaxID=246614 RepID=UPI003D9EFD5E
MRIHRFRTLMMLVSKFEATSRSIMARSVRSIYSDTEANFIKKYLMNYPTALKLQGFLGTKGYHFSLSNTRDEKRGTEIINGCASWGINWAYSVQETTYNRSLMSLDEFEFALKTKYRAYVINVSQKEIKNSRFRSISIDQSPGWSYTLVHPFELPDSNEFLQFDYFDRILPKVDRLVLSIDDHDCLNSALTGGKGSSLAKLNLMKDVIAEKDGEKCCFTVPKALVITNVAQNIFLDAAKSFDKIKALQKEVERADIEKICNDLIKHIEAQELTDHLKNVIRTKMNEYFGDSWQTEKFAVRSSAVGEDSETMSCAGQMETFLGVQGEEDIFQSIIKCWASQYRFIAVQYKRNNGQPVANDMAVVIQQLIECDKAGVLFTCDPVTSDLSQIVITANYGLGESVVSAISEPDTIRVTKEIDQQGNLSVSGIGEVVIGSKEKIVTTAGDQPGSQIMANERRENCCIDEKEVLKLSEVCLKICRFYRGSCDIEWGIKSSSDGSESHVYIFQCRPVTSINVPSDWQLIHELDSAHPCETECLTRANVGEVYPGASSHICLTLQVPLGSFGFIKRFLFAIKDFRLTPYVGRGIMFCRNNVFFCIKDGALMRYDQEPGKESLTTLGMEYSLLGRRMDDLQVKLDSYERLTTGPKIPAWKGLINLFQMIAPVYWRVKRFENKPLAIDVNDTQTNGTSHKLYLKLLRNFEHQWKAFDLHLCSTFASSIMNLLLIGLLSTKDDRHLFTDFSLLLSSCEKFVSARIPESLRELGELILPFKQQFLPLSDQQALQYLNDSKNPVYSKYKRFMEENGHRGLKEYDWSGKVWRKNPAAILQPLRILLQTDCASHGVTSKSNDDQIIEQLKTPLSKKSKFLLKRIALPLARTFVGTREESKNKCVWSIDQQRKVFDRIAEMCVAENLLPDASLLCYMTSFEIFQLTSQQKSDSQLVSIAKRRQKLLSTIDEYEYPSLVYGPSVEPSSRGIADISSIQIESSNTIKGTVVSRGKTRGKVYVARKIEDIDGIQAGDILVTYSTDVGWSPFFPIIGGLITEIGGLISHGAVVAREFGLPCVVGVRGATQVLKTGEIVTLDADNGIIMKMDDN